MAKTREAALLFPGQGAQYPRMAAGLYGHVDPFTSIVDHAFDVLGGDLRSDWLADRPSALFDDVTRAQPLLYVVGYALGRTLLDRDVVPAAMLGHSVGELVAATLAGVFSFDDGLDLLRDRVRHYADSPPGGMLAVAAPVDAIAPMLTGQLAIAAVNARRQILVAGPAAELASLANTLRANGITCMAAKARQAFHSPVVADAARKTIPGWRAVPLAPPRLPIYSSHLGTILGPDTATDPVFWSMQPTRTVQFWPTLDLLLSDHDLLLVEAGPGQGLTTIARTHPAVRSGRSDTVSVLPARPAGPAADRESLLAAVEHITTRTGASV